MRDQEAFDRHKDLVIDAEYERIVACLKTAAVKTASPSRAGFRVQCRVSWKDSKGKPDLGYFAIDTSNVANVGNATALRRDFLSSVFRVERWAKSEYEQARSGYEFSGGWVQFESALIDRFEAEGWLEDKKVVDKLLGQSLKAIRAVVNSGKDKKVRHIRNKQKARDYLLNALLYGLQSGLRDDEVRDLVKQALVEHTMKS